MPSHKIDLDTIQVVLQRSELDPRKVAEIMEDLRKQLAEQEEGTEEKAPPVKRMYVPVISDPEGRLGDEPLVGWVVQVPEDIPPAESLKKLYEAAYEHNVSKKGRKMPIETIGEACEMLSPKVTKELGVWIKTREPVEFVRSDNKIPLEKTDKRVKHGPRGQEAF
ncbi:MAG: hypothetical protein LBG65_08500 [Puniceicoccales bacterium]|jgi:hypothetical protein|nr:hypothetical protein [Puniceicoccales bacterium]